MKNPILFNSYSAEWNIFSAMFPLPFRYKGRWFKSIEHFYHFYKFHKSEKDHRALIFRTYNPYDAKKFGEDKSKRRQDDWDTLRLDVMKKAIYHAYMQNPNHMAVLQGTGKTELIHEAGWDSFWGNGKNGKGANQQGILLMLFRKEIEGMCPFELARNYARDNLK